MRRFATTAAVTLVALASALSTAPVTFAQEEGVTLDPGDPAAKEYALPHEEARREAGDSPDTKVQPGSRDSSLFGEGVTPEPSKGNAKRSGAAGDADADSKPASKPKSESKDDASATSPSREALAALGQSGDGGSGGDSGSGPGASVALVGGGAAVLFAVLLGGFGLRAVRGPRQL